MLSRRSWSFGSSVIRCVQFTDLDFMVCWFVFDVTVSLRRHGSHTRHRAVNTCTAATALRGRVAAQDQPVRLHANQQGEGSLRRGHNSLAVDIAGGEIGPPFGVPNPLCQLQDFPFELLLSLEAGSG